MSFVQLSIDDRELQRAIRHLGPRMGAVLAKSLNRTAFELRESEAAEVGRSFEFAGASTRGFLASKGAFLFDAATASKLEVRLYPRTKTGELLAPHVFGDTITPDSKRLKVGGSVAVPVGVRVGGRGRVVASQTPAALLRSRKAFFAGKALLVATGRGRSRKVKVAYALTERFTLERRFDFYGTARDTARRHFAVKAREEFGKLRV